MVDAPSDIGFVFFVGQRRGERTFCPEVVDGIVAVVYSPLHLVQSAFVGIIVHLQQHHFVPPVVEDDEISV